MIHSTVSAPKEKKQNTVLPNLWRSALKTTPVEEITVRQICEICGVTRQTFYRNFLDKYDLINWYFDKLLTNPLNIWGARRPFLTVWKEIYLYSERKSFFRRCLPLRQAEFSAWAWFRSDSRVLRKSDSRKKRQSGFTGNAFSSRNVLSGFHHHDRKMGAYRHGSDTFRVCRSSRPGNAGRLKTVPESATALRACVKSGTCRLRKWYRHALVIFTNFVLLFLSPMAIFLKCYTSLLLSLSFSLPDLLI